MSRLLTPTLAMLFLLLSGSPLIAHLTPNSELVLDFASGHIMLDAIIPEGDYRAAANAPRARDALYAARWLAGEVAATSPDGRRWRVAVERTQFVERAGPPDLHALIRLTPPPRASPRVLTLHWSAVIGQTPDHFVLLLVGADHGGGVLRSDRALIGALRGDRQSIVIDRGAPSAWAGFRAAFRLGMHHIAEGTDHLLFLLALLLPAPLLASGARWATPRRTAGALGKLAGTITAFTAGHSLTLVIAALTAAHLPPQPVELLIAVSIAIAALHAVRPIFPGREAWVAAGFGLVHGLAFATLVGDVGLGGGDRLLAILGFNLGIEAIQLGVAAVAIVPLIVMAPTPPYAFVRTGGGLFAGMAALAWIAQRVSGTDNGLAGAVEGVAAQAHWLLLALFILALAARRKFRAMATIVR